MTPLEAVRQAVITAVPEIVDNPHSKYKSTRPITLADVLRAIEKARGATGFAVYQGGQIWHQGRYTMFRWDLVESLEGQRDETISFIGNVLGVVGVKEL